MARRPASGTALARSLGLPRLRVERHLAALTDPHLVRLEPSKTCRVYALNPEQAALLNATFVSVVGRIDQWVDLVPTKQRVHGV